MRFSNFRITLPDGQLHNWGVSNFLGSDPHPQGGIWFNAGLGYGSLGCDGCGEREGGTSGQLAVGGAVSDYVLLGASINAWTKSEGDATLTAGLLAAMARFYVQGGFYFTAGLGVGILDADFQELGGDSETGFGVLLGLGLDARVGNNVSITPFLNGFSVETDAPNVTVWQIGVGITVH